MIVLDTNVVSELARSASIRSRAVSDWIDLHPIESFFLASVSVAELLAGVTILPSGRRRDDIVGSLEASLLLFRGRVLPFDSAAAGAYADIFAIRRRKGLSVPAFDLQIAAIARVAGMAVATRNVMDFQECGVEVVDPWTTSRP